MLEKQESPIAEYQEGFYIPLPRRPDAFCSDSVGPNVVSWMTVHSLHLVTVQLGPYPTVYVAL
jgi:hypothetical protein